MRSLFKTMLITGTMLAGTAGLSHATDVEVLEARFPLRLLRWGELVRWESTAGQQIQVANQARNQPNVALLANKPSGRQIAREPLEDELWPSRARLAASASRCSSWRSAASARGSR